MGSSERELATCLQAVPESSPAPFDVYTKIVQLTHGCGIGLMRTNIDIEDKLMRQAMRSSGARTKRAVVEEGLRLLIRTRDQRAIRRLRGKVAWEGDLEESRLGRAMK
jgi:Arc/MetJ family transcription regulator